MVFRKTEKKFKKFGKYAITGAVVGGTLGALGQAGGANAQKVTGPALQGLSLGAGLAGTAFGASVALDFARDLRKKGKGKRKKNGFF
jgi:hypothetical protein